MNCLHSFRTANKLKSHEKVCKNKNFFGILLPSEKDNVLEFNQYINSDKMSHIIHADIESLIKEMDVLTIQKVLQQQKLESIFLVDIQCQPYGLLVI